MPIAYAFISKSDEPPQNFSLLITPPVYFLPDIFQRVDWLIVMVSSVIVEASRDDDRMRSELKVEHLHTATRQRKTETRWAMSTSTGCVVPTSFHYLTH